MTAAEIIALVSSGTALVATVGIAIWKSRTDKKFREWQVKTTDEAVEMQFQFLEIEKARNEREQAEWDAKLADAPSLEPVTRTGDVADTVGDVADTAALTLAVRLEDHSEIARVQHPPRQAVAEPVSATETPRFSVKYAWRDSAKTWARLIARNLGPGDAQDVKLEIWGESGGERSEIGKISGMDRGESDQLKPNEAVHLAFVFTFGTPGPEDLRYRLTWTDDAGPHVDERQVPFF